MNLKNSINLKKVILLFFLLYIALLISCQKSDEKCGNILKKIEQNNRYFFVVETEFIYSYGPSNNIYTNDYNPQQGEVSSETFNRFNLGDNYCSTN